MHTFKLVCPRCRKEREIDSAVLPRGVNCGDCLMNDTEVVEMGVATMTATMRSGTQPTRYRIEMMVQNDWKRTVHTFGKRQEAKDAFDKMLADHPTWWLRLVSETVLETVTP